MESTRQSGVFNMEKLNHQFWLNTFDSVNFESAIEPSNTLTFIKNTESDIPFNFSEDEIHSIYKILESDYEVLKSFFLKRQGLIGLSYIDSKELQGLINWLVKTLNNWKEIDDKNYKVLSLCLYIASILDENIWNYIDNQFVTEEVENAIIGRIINFHIGLNISGNNVPIWECEKADDFQKAVDEENWLLLADTFPALRRSFFYKNAFSFFQQQIFLFGLTFSIRKLNFALDSYDDFFSMMLMADKCDFNFKDRFKLILESNNWLWKFALLFSLELRKNITFSIEENELLAQVFENISLNKDLQKDWFTIFNRYLVRYYFFSKAFGIYLAKYASDDDMDVYLQSLGNDRLYCDSEKYSGDGNIVTDVFMTFDSIASDDRKNIFWKKCYQRYIKYDFGSDDEDFFMNSVCYSIFDYAVVSYLVECIDDNQRSEIHEIALKNLKEFDMEWFGSETSFISASYKYLSILQPIYHSGFVIKNEEGKLQTPNKYYIPEYLVNDQRLQMMMRLQ